MCTRHPTAGAFVRECPTPGGAVYAALGTQTALLAGLAAVGVRSALRRDHRATVLRGGAGADAVFGLLGEGAQPLSAEFFAGDAGSGLPRS